MSLIPVLLDTDIGSDIDDALALAYLLRHPECHLTGVTTVSGEPCKRAALVRWLCTVAGRPEVPVYCGTEPPLLGTQRQPLAHQHSAIPAEFAETRHPESHAVDFMRDEITKHPGEVTLLAIGPLTNVGLLFATYPFIPQLLRSLVIMGGDFRPNYDDSIEEWNIKCDPAAASIVLARVASPFLAVGLNVTTRCRLTMTAMDALLSGKDPLKAAVNAMARVWYDSASEVTFHDPLAAALIFQPNLCETVSTSLHVDICSADSPGATIEITDDTAKPHQIATNVDTQQFFTHYSSVLETRHIP